MKWTLRNKLVGIFGILVLMMVVLGFVYWRGMERLAAQEQKYVELMEMKAKLIFLQKEHYQWVESLREAVLTKGEFKGEVDPSRCEFGKWYDAYRQPYEELNGLFMALKAPHEKLHQEGASVVHALERQDWDEADKISQHIRRVLLPEMMRVYNPFVEELGKVVERVQAAGKKEYDHVKYTFMALLLLAFIAVVSSINYLNRILIQLRRRQEEMDEVQREISAAVNILASSSNQILALTSQLAISSSETATAIAETTTTMEEVKQTSRQMSERAAAVSEAAQGTAHNSEAGRRSVEETIAGMGRIKGQMDVVAGNIVRLSEQSQTIGTIIDSVNDLANQSNLLAVNASIEAAKAGEEGKGFAVVAQEVRRLAEQSKDATTQVKTILGDIQKAINGVVMATDKGSKAVEAGLEQSQASGESIGRIAEDIVQAAQGALQISVATNEQVVGIDQVSAAMENIKKATEQIVASTRQSEESSKSLHELGLKLKELVEKTGVKE